MNKHDYSWVKGKGHLVTICSVTLLHKMSNMVTSHDLPCQAIGPVLSTQHCCSSFKSFFISKNHHTWGFHLLIPYKQNPHTDQPACCNCYDTFTDWHTAVCGICRCSVVANRLSWAALETSLACSTFKPHLDTDHTCDLPEMRKIFQLHYAAVNQSPSQQMCNCLATGDIALCLHAVQQCCCKIILRERK